MRVGAARSVVLVIALSAAVMWRGEVPAFACSCAASSVGYRAIDAGSVYVARPQAANGGKTVRFNVRQTLKGPVQPELDVPVIWAMQNGVLSGCGIGALQRYVDHVILGNDHGKPSTLHACSLIAGSAAVDEATAALNAPRFSMVERLVAWGLSAIVLSTLAVWAVRRWQPMHPPPE